MKLVSESIENLYDFNVLENLIGGKGDKTTSKDVSKKQLEIGIAVEREHSSSKKIDKEIALDHLTENPRYYSDLIEKGMVDEDKAIKIYIKHFGKSKLPDRYKKDK